MEMGNTGGGRSSGTEKEQKISTVESWLFGKLSKIGEPDQLGVKRGSSQTTFTNEKSDITTDCTERILREYECPLCQ